MPDDCIFCRIIAGEVPADVVHRDSDVVAFRDLSPKAEVHVLVVPTRHMADLLALGEDPDLLASVVRVAGQVAASQADGQFRLVFNTGSAAGQTVFHAHGHVLAGAGASGVGL